MQIHGMNKTTLLDYPGIVATTLFTGNCNFRCPFCQNADLVLDPMSQPLISEEEIFSHLKKRKGIVKGVCVTGGEPTLQPDIMEFLSKIHEIGLLVKLDSNGYRPEVLRKLLESGCVDYFAMDIKTSLDEYDKVAGVKIDSEKINESVSIIMNSGKEYEFRTTVVRELHNKENFEKIAELLSGAKQYFLQGYVDSERVISPGFTAYSLNELEEFKEILQPKIKKVYIRGVE